MATYINVAASQTGAVLGFGGGKTTGQQISHVIIFPATTSPGAVALIDGSTSKTIFPGGASSVASLAPFTVYLDVLSKTGAWSITTGADVSVWCVGSFN